MCPEGIPSQCARICPDRQGQARGDRLTSIAEVGLELDAVHRFTFVDESIVAKLEKLSRAHPPAINFRNVDNYYTISLADHVI
jgi:hypothetical protein